MVCTARPLFKWNDEGIARVISRKNNGHVRVYIGTNFNFYIDQYYED